MANKFRTTVRVEGLQDALRKLRKVSDRGTSEKVLKGAIRDGGEIVRERASQLAPVGTEPLSGRSVRLRDGLRVRTAGRAGFFTDSDGVWIQVAPLKEVSHANLQEFGTKNHAAQPFMRPAYDQTEGKVIATVRGKIADAIKKATR